MKLGVLLLFVIVVLCTDETFAGSLCYENKNGTDVYYGYCDHGCCGTDADRSCCKEEIWHNPFFIARIVGGAFGAVLMLISCIAMICIFKSANKHSPSRGRVVNPSPSTISNGVISGNHTHTTASTTMHGQLPSSSVQSPPNGQSSVSSVPLPPKYVENDLPPAYSGPMNA